MIALGLGLIAGFAFYAAIMSRVILNEVCEMRQELAAAVRRAELEKGQEGRQE
jgi:hypothetical protein